MYPAESSLLKVNGRSALSLKLMFANQFPKGNQLGEANMLSIILYEQLASTDLMSCNWLHMQSQFVKQMWLAKLLLDVITQYLAILILDSTGLDKVKEGLIRLGRICEMLFCCENDEGTL